jgi:asparagine synthase (glutamine-hydrolysing)
MCGIAGIVCGPGESERGQRSRGFLDLLRHRGPDDHGWLAARGNDVRLGKGDPEPGDVVLVHRRLSILDLSEAGRQPMGTPDGRYYLVFNGEIYNFVELRAELERLGRVFHSHSDSEVLLQACAEWGTAALPRLVGMFALALLDRTRRTLLLARDFFGIKPLYYSFADRHCAFASEIKALVAGTTPRIQAHRLYEYLVAGRTDHGPDTLFAGIRQLPAAHYLEIALDDPRPLEPTCYWKLDSRERLDLSFAEAAAQTRALFLDSVRLHLRSDVPVGAALSGGIDSSAIVAAMRHVAPGAELHTFSYVADDAELCEERWVDIAARAAGAVQHKVHATAEELQADLDHLIYAQDEPFGSTSIYVQHRVFRLARQAGIKVMLDGQGADEMLAGYRYYVSARLASLLRQGRWFAATRLLRHAAGLPGTSARSRLLLQAFGLLVPGRCKALAKQLLGRELLPSWLNASWFRQQGALPFDLGGHRGRDVLRAHLQRTLFETSLPMLLRYEDRNSMAHSIESRVPFLTPQLAEFLLRLPEEYLLGPDGTSKRVFRAAMRGLVPDTILDRRDKIGFATPERTWFMKLRPWVDATLASPTAQAIPALNLPAMIAEWQAIAAGQRPFDFRVWRWVNFIRWAERFQVEFASGAAGSPESCLAA